jgi:hypothetical protein
VLRWGDGHCRDERGGRPSAGRRAGAVLGRSRAGGVARATSRGRRSAGDEKGRCSAVDEQGPDAQRKRETGNGKMTEENASALVRQIFWNPLLPHLVRILSSVEPFHSTLFHPNVLKNGMEPFRSTILLNQTSL